MGYQRFRVRPKAIEGCDCWKIDASTGGADAGQNETGITDWSMWCTMGGFALQCDDTDDGQSANGTFNVTCTNGGTPTPRLILQAFYDYLCYPCAG